MGNTIITATLDNSETSQEFIATLPCTFSMNRYDNREYYSGIETLSENGVTIADFSDGDVTYFTAGPSFAVFFAGENHSNQGNLIRMGRITSDLSVFDTLGESIEMLVEIAK